MYIFNKSLYVYLSQRLCKKCTKISPAQMLAQGINTPPKCVVWSALQHWCGEKSLQHFYKMLQNWREEIINSFTKINGRRINNSYMESKNKEVGRLIFSANGFKNFKRTRNRMLYCLNEEDTFNI